MEKDSEPLLIRSLLHARAYPHPVSKTELLETHISWVILTGEYAYKIKKPVVLSFLDFGTLARRKHYCEEELRLNRKWSPELYLDVVPISGSDKSPTVGGNGEIIEYAVKMRQFPQEARLDAQLDAGVLTENDMNELGAKVAAYHHSARSIDFVSEEVALQRIAKPVDENFTYTRPHIASQMQQRIEGWTEEGMRRLRAELIDRHKDGHIRECHGDLHLANMVRLPSGIAAFDCVEFSSELRDIDTMSDISFLAMDLASRGRPELCYLLLNRYLECSGDYTGMSLFGLYFVYHCMIRAKVAAIRCSERTDEAGREHDRAELAHYCDIALKWIDRPAPVLIAMHGFSGSGKTWLSSRIMGRLPAIRVRSDIERKRAFGLKESADSQSNVGEGLYTENAKADVYEMLLNTSEGLLEAGFNVIIDASFLSREARDSVRALASRIEVPFVFVDTTASNEELDRRLRQRATVGGDASEADISVLGHQLETADPLDPEECDQTLVVATGGILDVNNVLADIEKWISTLFKGRRRD